MTHLCFQYSFDSAPKTRRAYDTVYQNPGTTIMINTSGACSFCPSTPRTSSARVMIPRPVERYKLRYYNAKTRCKTQIIHRTSTTKLIPPGTAAVQRGRSNFMRKAARLALLASVQPPQRTSKFRSQKDTSPNEDPKPLSV